MLSQKVSCVTSDTVEKWHGHAPVPCLRLFSYDCLRQVMVLRSYEMLRIVMMCLSAQFEITLWQSYHNVLRSKMRMGHGPLKGGKNAKIQRHVKQIAIKKS